MPDVYLGDAIRHTRLRGESETYLAKREELRLAEIESMKLRDRVAELRRQLPHGAVVEDYAFTEGPAELDAGDTPVRTVRLSELFSTPNRAVVIYHLMFGKRQTKACPMCTLWIDGLNGVAHHLAQNVDLAIVAAADPAALRAHARQRGWNKVRLLSAAEGSAFKYDLGSEDLEGNQDSRCPCSRASPAARFVTSTVRIPIWPPTSGSAASICCRLSTMFSTSRHGDAAIGTRLSITGRR